MKDWLKLKRYTHFSPPLERKHIPFIRSYVSDPTKVKRHRFYPFIHYTIQDNRFRRLRDEAGVRKKQRALKPKKREIFYADHLDAQVFAYYSHLISQKLEDRYQANSLLNDCVIAYRSIPFNQHRSKSTIDFAKEVFDFIRQSPKESLSVICFDIKSFFDSLDHKILKRAWYKLLGGTCLPDDHYQVFKAITKFTYVEIGDLIEEFDELKIQRLQYLKKKKVKSFCKSGEEFRKRVAEKGLINFNKYDFEEKRVRTYGIPQGSPISAVLSNLYLLQLDEALCAKAHKMGGLYRRYSDDLLFVCPPSKANEVKKNLIHSISAKLKLIIQEEKTQEILFEKDTQGEGWSSYLKDPSGAKIPSPLSYLGFDFDGKNIRVRQKSLSKYYRKVKRMIRRKAKYALYAKMYNARNRVNKKDPWIYRERIYKSKSHLGAKKKKVNGVVFWGNFISYMKTASTVMKEPAIRRQIRNHWRIIEREIKKWEEAYGLTKTPSRRRK